MVLGDERFRRGGNIDGAAWEHGIYQQAPATNRPTTASLVNGTPPAVTQFDGSSPVVLSAVRAAVLDRECLSSRPQGCAILQGQSERGG